MQRKDLLELTKRFKKEQCTFTKVCGCYVNNEKKPVFQFKETFLNLPDDELFKYLEIAKKVLSGKIDNNILELTFPLNEKLENEKQQFMMMLKKSALKEDALLSILYESIIDHYDHSGNYLILLYHDAYDVMTKTSDNRKLDESEEVYEYIICAICPVSLSKPGLGYFSDENKIKSRIRDWIVEPPILGFTYPGFIDRSTDVNTVMYYTKNAKNPHPEMMECALGCIPKQTATIHMETFESMVKDIISVHDETPEEVFIDIQDSLNSLVEDHHEIHDEPIILTKNKVRTVLKDSGISDEISVKIEDTYEETFGDDLPIADHLVDTKLIKKHAQKRKEEQLLSQIEALESQLIHMDDENLSTSESVPKDYDVVLHVKPEKLETIKTEMIEGQRCIVIPMNDDEQATVNDHVIQ